MRARLSLAASVLSLVCALMLAALPGAHAQTDAAAVTALQEEVKELKQRLQDLEDKFVDVQGEGLKVRGPFTVLNPEESPVFQVIGTGGQSVLVFVGGDSPGVGGAKILLEAGTGASPGGRLTLNSSAGAPVFQAGELGGKATAIVGDKAGGHVLLESDGTTVQVAVKQSDDRQVSLQAGAEKVALEATSDGNTTTVGDSSGTVGVVLTIGGTKLAEFSKWSDRPAPSLRIFSAGGGQVAGVGADPANPANGSVNIAGADAEVWINGEGWVKLLQGNQERIKLDGTKQTITMSGAAQEGIVLNADKRTVAIKGSGNLQMVIDGEKGYAVQMGENKVATLGYKSGSGNPGELMIFSGSGAPLLQATGDGSGAQVIIGDESTPHIKMDTSNGQAEIAAETGDQNSISMIAAPGVAHLRADTEGFAVSFGKLDGQIGMIIEQGNRLMAEFSKPNDRNAATVRVYGAGGNIVAGMGGQSGDPETGLIVAGGPKGQAMLTGAGWMGLKDGDQLKVVASAPDRSFAIYDEGPEYILTLGPGKGGGNITTYTKAGLGVFSAGAAADGGGEACVLRHGEKLHCLGVGLPLMGGGN